MEYGAGLALGPDEKIYSCYYHRKYLGVINDPNQVGAACNYVHIGIYIAPGISKVGLGLPNQIYYPPEIPCLIASHLNFEISICSNQSHQLPSGTAVGAPGLYFDTTKNQLGTCDSITYETTLLVYNVIRIDTSVHI